LRGWIRQIAGGVSLLGLAGGLLTGCQRPRAESAPGKPSGDPFLDVTQAAGLSYRLTPARRPLRILESVGSGCGFLDYDRDGLLDLLLVGTPRCALYRNRGDGTFGDVTQNAGLGAEGPWIGCASGDYDNDGDPDLFITGYTRCVLYQNDGDGRFSNATAPAGIRMTPWSTAAAFADLDRDGLLDLYVGAYAKFGPGAKQYCTLHKNGIKTSCRPFDYDPILGQCYRNLGSGRFEDVTRRWGFDRAHGRNLGVAVADYNRDGWPDVYLANDEIEGDLFQNQKGRGFKNVGVETGTAYNSDGDRMGGMGVDWGDYDNDGWLDLLVGTYENEPKALFRNLKGEGFESVANPSQILKPTYKQVVWGSLLFDYDNDGWLDLLFVNGHVYDNVAEVLPGRAYRQPATLFRNQANGVYAPVSSPTLAVPIAGRGLACGDYDNDGDQDLLIVDMDGEARLLRNESPRDRHWLQVQVRGNRANRDGLGAVVSVVTDQGRQTTEVRTARSYASICDPRVQFGIGSAARAREVEVRWPGGGVTRRTDVPAGQVLTLAEEK